MKVKKFLIALLVNVLLSVIAVSPLLATAAVYADGSGQTAEQTSAQETPSAEMEELTDSFVNYLKAHYGDDYQYYYNQIIGKWGSVEAYLLSFGEKLPEEHKTGWQKFVAWLSEYSSVWAPAFAVAIVVAVSLFGKKQFNKIIERIVNARLKPIENELNLQSDAMVSVMRAQKALLGTGERFAGNVRELDESEKGLKNG